MEDLNERPFMGRAVFIREVGAASTSQSNADEQDREQVPRHGAPIQKMGMADRGSFGAHTAPGVANRNIFVGNVSHYPGLQLTEQLPLEASWQDLKDLMRQAGEVIRADVGTTPDGRPKGNGTVVFTEPEAARAAIRTSRRLCNN